MKRRNLILEETIHVEYFTYLRDVFKAVSELSDFHWVINDLETNSVDSRLQVDHLIISGKELNTIVQRENPQFVWGVLSGFLEEVQSYPQLSVWADGNENIWSTNPKVQLPGAELEIVCWDGTCTLFIGCSEKIAKILEKTYPDIEDLIEHNRKHG